MSARTLLFTALILLPSVFGRHVEYSRTRRGLAGALKHSKNSKNGNNGIKPHLRMRSVPPEFVYLSPGDSEVLECDAGGNPPPTIHWLKNGKRIHGNLIESDRVDDGNLDTDPVLGLSFTKSKLFLDCATERDAAEYTCVAQNPYFRSSAGTTVHVINDSAAAENAFCLGKKSYGVPARINMWTHIRMELIGSDVQLFCRTEGRPRPEATWINYQDDRLIRKSDKYRILDNGDLIVRNIDWSDMGGYVCAAENAHGTDRSTTFLYPTKPEK